MSNLIKYPYVNMQGKEAKVIHYESEEEKFQPLDAKKKVVMKTFEEVAKEERERAQEETGDESFQEGLPVTNYDEVIEEKIQKAEEEAAAAIAEARQQANEIVEQANNRKNQILEEGRQEGITRGYEEGLLQAQKEIQAQKDELSSQQLKKEQEYQQMLAETEGRYVDVLCNLIRKLSGVILTDRKDVILHLIRSGIADMEPAKRYIIRVASDDLLYVEGEKDALMEKAGITGTIEVQEEKSLSEGDCIIETDNQMIDCGFRTQLDNMVRTLRMLV